MKSHSLKYMPVFFFPLALVLTIGSLNPVQAQDQQELSYLSMGEFLIKDGKMYEAIVFAKALRDYLNEKLPDYNLRVYVRTFGQFGKMYMIGEVKNPATLEMERVKIYANPDFRTLAAQGVGIFVEGESYDMLLRLVP